MILSPFGKRPLLIEKRWRPSSMLYMLGRIGHWTAPSKLLVLTLYNEKYAKTCE